MVAAVITWLPIGVSLSAPGATAGTDREIGSRCRVDRDCRGYYRCQDRVCSIPPAVVGHGDGKAPTVEIFVDGTSRGRFFVELARDRFEQARGLSHRPYLAGGWGMLFVYPKTVQHAFTMALMRFPLDIIFIGDGGRVVDIIEGAQPKALFLAPSGAYRYVLELNAGAVRAQGIRVGDAIRLTGVPPSRIPAGG